MNDDLQNLQIKLIKILTQKCGVYSQLVSQLTLALKDSYFGKNNFENYEQNISTLMLKIENITKDQNELIDKMN